MPLSVIASTMPVPVPARQPVGASTSAPATAGWLSALLPVLARL
jgi:hypothetical protein